METKTIEKLAPVMGKIFINLCPFCNAIPILSCTLIENQQIEENTKIILRNDFDDIYYDCECPNCGFKTDLHKWNKLKTD